jgi:hypothetical protein
VGDEKTTAPETKTTTAPAAGESSKETPAKESTTPDAKEAGAAGVAAPGKDTKSADPAAGDKGTPSKEETKKDSKTEPDPKAKKEDVKYDLKLPKGSRLSESVVEEVTAFAKDRGLSNDQAQAMLDRQHNALEATDKANRPGGAEWKKRVDTWEGLIQADPELGGEKMKENAEVAARVVKRFGSESLQRDLQETGFGSHPELVRLLTRIGRAMGESKLVTGEGKAGEVRKDTAAKLFDHPNSKG